MAKRKNHHKIVLGQAVPELEKQTYHCTQFHHFRKMPKSLAGVPDLYVMWHGRSWWVEIKPKYQNYMRDQMSDIQWQWFHDRREDFRGHMRYGIVEDAEELLDFVLMTDKNIYIPDYHWSRYDTWRKGR